MLFAGVIKSPVCVCTRAGVITRCAHGLFVFIEIGPVRPSCEHHHCSDTHTHMTVSTMFMVQQCHLITKCARAAAMNT
jgi:hypothetical protein